MSLFGDDEDIEVAEDDDFVAASGDALLPPRQSAVLYGHEEIEKRLLKLVAGERVPGALVFAGHEGIGKETLAFRFARYLFEKGGDEDTGALFGEALPEAEPESLYIDPETRSFRQVASGGHPDLIHITTPEDKNILPVEECRKIAPYLRMRPSYGGYRVAIVDGAETMNRSAQNALLKILEEPPENAILILVTSRPGLLLPTIRSRCQSMHIKPLAYGAFERIVDLSADTRALESAKKQLLYEMSGGSPGLAIRYAQDNLGELLQDIAQAIAPYPGIDWVRAHALADFLSGNAQDRAYRDLQDVLIRLIHRAVTGKARNGATEGVLSSLTERQSLENLCAICENLEAHFARANGLNLDKRQTVLGMFMAMQNGKTQ